MPVDSSAQKKPVIIITDDRRATRHMIRSTLEPEGYELLEAENGREALDLCALSRPDLILLDIIMPVMDGFETCRQIKELPNGNHLPILMFTAYDEGREVEKAFEAGASDFINKPINPEELRHRVNRLLYLRKLEMKRQAAESRLKSSHEMIQSLSRRILNAYEEERTRLARELHDEVGTTLSTLKLNLQLLNRDFPARDSDYEERLSSLIASASYLLGAIRNKAIFLRPPSLDELGLVAVVSNMANEFNRHSGIHVELQTNGNGNNIPAEVETALYRCIQEALTNVARHSSAARVSVNLDIDSEGIVVRVKDDGIGFDPQVGSDTGEHLGLQGMKERVALLNGNIEIDSAPGKGTDIKIIIPLIDHRE